MMLKLPHQSRLIAAGMHWRYGRLCILIVLSLLLGLPLREAGFGSIIFGGVVASILYAAACAAGITDAVRRAYILTVTPVILIDAWIATQGSDDWLALIASGSHSVIYCYTALAILFHILKEERVTLDTILGGITVYLLIGIIFGYLYCMSELMVPGSFLEHGKPVEPPLFALYLVERRPEMIYFSIMTLTTVGFGDITPVRSLARVLAMGEALCGQTFLATFLAFLVGNYLSQRQAERAGEQALETAASLVADPVEDSHAVKKLEPRVASEQRN